MNTILHPLTPLQNMLKFIHGLRKGEFSRKQGGIESMQPIYQLASSIPLHNLSVMGGVLLVVAVAMLLFKFRRPEKSEEKDEIR